jgi:hypothetical protein
LSGDDFQKVYCQNNQLPIKAAKSDRETFMLIKFVKSVVGKNILFSDDSKINNINQNDEKIEPITIENDADHDAGSKDNKKDHEKSEIDKKDAIKKAIELKKKEKEEKKKNKGTGNKNERTIQEIKNLKSNSTYMESVQKLNSSRSTKNKREFYSPENEKKLKNNKVRSEV